VTPPDDKGVQTVTVTIDGVPVRVPKGTLLVEAAKQIKQEIPVYCYHTKLGPAGLCRICLVEIEGMPKLQIACNTPVSDGMIVHTNNDKVSTGRSMVVELFLVNHPLDCPICDKGGECDLQDYAMAYGRGTSAVVDGKSSKPKAVDLGPTIVLDEERCVVCQRCVRFDDIIADERQLVLKDRGVRDIIATAEGDPYRHNFTGNVTELCPVGALTSKTYRFKSRPWDLARTQTSCTQCAVGCQMFSDVRFGSVLRTMSVETDDAISDGWLCDRGRYNIGFYASRERLTQPLFKKDGRFVQIGWDDAFALWAKAVRDAIATGGASSVGAIGGGRLTNEEAYVLQDVFRKVGVENVDWRAGSQRQATPADDGGTYADLERAQIVYVVGESSAERAPVMDLRIKKAVRGGAKRIAVASLDEIPKDAAGKTVAIVWDGVDAQLVQAVRTAAAASTVHTYIASEQGNARGAEAMGMLPGPGAADFDAMLASARDGKLGALCLFGVNPALNHPDGPGVRAALEKTAFVVASDLFLTETAQLATLVLPAKGAFEKHGTTINIEGRLLPVNASLVAPDGVLSDLEMVVGLAQQLDIALPTEEEVEKAVIARAASAKSGVRHPERSAEVRHPERSAEGAESRDRDSAGPSTALANARSAQDDEADTRSARGDGGGYRVVIESRIFAGGGTVAHDERIAELRPLPEAAFAPQDAETLGIATCDYVDLNADGTTMHDVLVEVRGGIARGTVALIGGLPDAAANVFGIDARVTVANVRKAAAEAVH
jgi:NADH-quinone oxidoreductase subunit G